MKAFDFYEPGEVEGALTKEALYHSRDLLTLPAAPIVVITISIASYFSATSDAEYLTSTSQSLLAPEALTKTKLRRPEDQKEPRP